MNNLTNQGAELKEISVNSPLWIWYAAAETLLVVVIVVLLKFISNKNRKAIKLPVRIPLIKITNSLLEEQDEEEEDGDETPSASSSTATSQ